MTNFTEAERIISSLLENPEQFSKYGTGFTLLSHYFDGMPLDTLRPLLAHPDPVVREEASWIASELGEDAQPLLSDIIPLLSDESTLARYQAFEVVAACSVKSDMTDERGFVRIVRALDDSDGVISRLAMRLVCRLDCADIEQLSTVFRTGHDTDAVHYRGLSCLATESSLSRAEVMAMLGNSNLLLRRYGAIAAIRMSVSDPNLLEEAKRSTDSIVRRFAHDAT